MRQDYALRVETCLGEICVEPYPSLEYPGVWIDLVRPDGKLIQLATVECKQYDLDEEPILHVLAWDGDHEDYVSETVVNADGECAYE